MKQYRVTTPDVGLLEKVAWHRMRWSGKAVGYGISMDGTPLLRVRVSPKDGVGNLDIGKGSFTKRNPSNNPTVYFFNGKWWVRAKRSRREWDLAQTYGSHYICHFKDQELARWTQAQDKGLRYSVCATWMPAEKRNKDGSRTCILYEVNWRV